ncbi:MAG: hypothetical protein P9L91_00545 [Candidatus Zophobacter franzmannii]|nr:hypothetical protein [Candidatus Zophobacter franzmannii]
MFKKDRECCTGVNVSKKKKMRTGCPRIKEMRTLFAVAIQP